MAALWTPAEDEILRASMRAGKNYGQISVMLHNRTPRGVAHRWSVLRDRDGLAKRGKLPAPINFDVEQTEPVHYLETLELQDAIAWTRWNYIPCPKNNFEETTRYINAARLKFGLPMWRIVPNRRVRNMMPAPSVDFAEERA
jgi:hypothetical protein